MKERKKRKNTFTDEIDLLRKFISQFLTVQLYLNAFRIYITPNPSLEQLDNEKTTEEQSNKKESKEEWKIMVNENRITEMK